MCPRAAWPNGLQGGATHVTSAFLREGVPIWSIRALTLTRTRIRTYSPRPVTSLYPPAACTFCSAIARLIRCCLPHSWTDHKEGGCGCVSVCLGGHVWSATHSCNRLQGQGAPLHTHARTHAHTHTHTHIHTAEVKEPGASSGVRLSPLYTCSGLCNQRALTLPSWTIWCDCCPCLVCLCKENFRFQK